MVSYTYALLTKISPLCKAAQKTSCKICRCFKAQDILLLRFSWGAWNAPGRQYLPLKFRKQGSEKQATSKPVFSMHNPIFLQLTLLERHSCPAYLSCAFPSSIQIKKRKKLGWFFFSDSVKQYFLPRSLSNTFSPSLPGFVAFIYAKG